MKDEYKAVGSWGTLGLEVVLSVMIGFFGGRWLDAHAGTTPWLSVLGFFFGCGAAAKAILRTTKEMADVTAREEREHGNPAPLFDSAKEREEKEREEKDHREGSLAERDSPMTSAERDDERPS
jgi:hypothetical protein